MLVAALFAGYVYFGDRLAEFGRHDQPQDLGDEPSRPATAEASTTARALDDLAPPDQLDLGGEQMAASPPPREAPEAPALPATQVDDGRVQELRQRAETAYRAFDWNEARLAARQLQNLALDPTTRVRAGDILRGADALQELFERLDGRDELQRSLDTDPRLVTVNHRGDEVDVLPVLDMRDKVVPDTADSAAWMRQRLASQGEVAVLFTSGAAGVLRAGEISQPRPAELSQRLAERRADFERRLARLGDDERASDPLAWYEAARFAYRNRLDDRVTEMLDRALELDPFLAATIRADKAREVYFNMVQMLERGNRAGAAGWKVILDRHYSDTPIYDEAVAYYMGNVEQLRQARQRAEAERRAAAERARAERLARAKALDDRASQRAIEGETIARQPTEPDPRPTAPASGDRAEADAAFARGVEILTRAQHMGVTPERDRTYGEAQTHFDRALELYRRLGLEAEMVRANQYRYACIKYRRF